MYLRVRSSCGFSKSLPVFEEVVSVPSHAIRNRDDNYALRFTGLIHIPQSGEYTFYLSSDDGSRLVLDGTELISNDGIHGVVELMANVTLSQGQYPIEVEYFERDGGQYLDLKYDGPNISKQEVLFVSFHIKPV